MSIAYLVLIVFRALYYLLLARVIISFFPNIYQNPIGRFIYDTTEPALSKIRKIMPDTGMIDFSPLVAFLLLEVIQSVILRFL